MVGSNYVIAIPSYNRVDEIIQKTLQTLYDYKINKNKIYIFVANKEQYKMYHENVPKELYNKIVIGKLGITHQRIFISKYFLEKQYIISLDDDIEEVLQLKSSVKVVKVKDLHSFFLEAYELMKEEGLNIWGIYPVNNPFFMKPNVTDGLKFIIGVMYGYINRHNKKLYPSQSIEMKEDYEMSILFYKMDGGVIRFNNITVKTKFNATGGLGADRFDKSKRSAEYLKKTYPDIISIFHRKNGMAEVRMARMLRQNN